MYNGPVPERLEAPMECNSRATEVVMRLCSYASFFFSFSIGYAQIETASLVGNVTDPSGSVVVGAQVTVTNLGTQAVRTETTNSVGFYDFELLQVGRYSVSESGRAHV